MYSWAIPGAVLPGPGEKKLAPQTEVHRFGYKDFQGRIGSGYGAGDVRQADLGKVLVTKVTPGTVSFTLAHTKVPVRYSLVKIKTPTGRDWLLINKPVPGSVPGVGDKPKYQMIQAADMDEAMAQAANVQEKIDGAHGVIDIGDQGKVEAYSVNPRVTGEPIPHTERLGIHGLEIPELKGTTLRGEMYGSAKETGKAIPFNRISGILNASIAKSLEKQKADKVKMQVGVFDVLRHKGKPVEFKSEAERQALLDEIIGKLPAESFHKPLTATTPEEKADLISDIRTGKNPRTEEGVVMRMPNGNIKKFKLRPENTAYMTGIFPGEGKRQALGGGFTYGTTPGGPTVGNVGTGFTDQELAETAKNLKEYMGKPMRIEHMGQFESGKYRAPSWKGWETDVPEKAAFSDEKTTVIKKAQMSDMAQRLVAAIPFLAASSMAHVKQRRAAGEYERAWQDAPRPWLLRPFAPSGTNVVSSQRDVEKLVKRVTPPGDPLGALALKHKLQTQLARTGLNAFSGTVQGPKGEEPTAIISRDAPTAIYKHEYGHIQTIIDKIKAGKSTASHPVLNALLTPIVGVKRTPEYRGEEAAWNRSGTDDNDPLRQAALKTYEAGGKGIEWPIRYGIPGYAAIRLMQGGNDQGVMDLALRKVMTTLKGVGTTLKGNPAIFFKHGQATTNAAAQLAGQFNPVTSRLLKVKPRTEALTHFLYDPQGVGAQERAAIDKGTTQAISNLKGRETFGLGDVPNLATNYPSAFTAPEVQKPLDKLDWQAAAKEYKRLRSLPPEAQPKPKDFKVPGWLSAVAPSFDTPVLPSSQPRITVNAGKVNVNQKPQVANNIRNQGVR